jgi:hypothetical protein
MLMCFGKNDTVEDSNNGTAGDPAPKEKALVNGRPFKDSHTVDISHYSQSAMTTGILLWAALYTRGSVLGCTYFASAPVRGFVLSNTPFIAVVVYRRLLDRGIDAACVINHMLSMASYCGRIAKWCSIVRLRRKTLMKEVTLTGAITTGFDRPKTAPLSVIIERNKRNGRAKAFLKT